MSNNGQKINELFKRICPNFRSGVDSAPLSVYKCFSSRGILPSSVSTAYFMLTAISLNFIIDYPLMPKESAAQYGFASIQIKDISSVCASYEKRFNFGAMIMGMLLFSLAIMTLTAANEGMAILGVFLIFGALALVLGSFTYLRIKQYKVCIGTPTGGMTIIGSSGKLLGKGIVWNQPNTILYNAIPNESEFYTFIEEINWRIASLQERGEQAFSGE